MLVPDSDSWQYVKVRLHTRNSIVSDNSFSPSHTTLFAILETHYLCLAVASYGPTSTVSCLLFFFFTVGSFSPSFILYLSRPPPGAQAGTERYSLVYFCRPGNSVILRALVDESPLIANAVARNPEKNYETGCTAHEWFTRRIKNQRMKNRKVRCCYLTQSVFH